MNNLERKKRRTLKNLRRKRVWPSVVTMVLMVVLLGAAAFAFEVLIGFIMFESQIAERYQNIESIIQKVEASDGDRADYAEMLSELERSGAKQVILCGEEQDVIGNAGGGQMPDMGDGVHFVAVRNGYVVYYTGDIFFSAIGDGFLEELQKNLSKGTFISSDSLHSERYLFDAWIRIPLEDGNILYLSVPVSIGYKEQLYMAVSVWFIVVLACIPLISYIAETIRSIVSQGRLTKLFYFDTVTLGKNWLYFREKAGRAIRKRRKGDIKYFMICLHVNKYRNYCTCYGTAEGEKLLENMYKLLEREMKKKWMFARHSDAEFGIFMPAASEKDVEEQIGRLENVLMTAAEGKIIHLSFGVCEITDRTADVDEWYVCASMARPDGSGDTVKPIGWFNEQMKQERLWEHHVEERMQQALDAGEFQVYVQPKYDPTTEELVGGEALIRWISPTDGFIGPGKFIPIFEKNSFITKIDNFMVSEVSKLQAAWIAEGRKAVPISINLSRAHFADPGLPELVCSLVDAHGVPHDLIELEITESVFFDDKQALLAAVDKLHDMGFEISMDDFGSGYSSLNSLKDLELDVLKLDGEFFRGEKEKGRGDIVVADAIQLAKHLNMRIVAEGVEQKEQVDFLANIGCDMIQGFYFAKPMPAAEFANRLQAN